MENNSNNKKFNLKKIGMRVLSLVLVFGVFISCFAISASAADNSFPFSREWLYDYGLLDNLSDDYSVFMPIADSDNRLYYRCDLNGNAASINSTSGKFTVSDWGRGTLTSGVGWSYSKRIGFKQTYDGSQYDNFRTIANFMVIPKGKTVKVSFIFRITGTVSGWENTPFSENVSLSFYSAQSHTVSNKTANYITNVESSYWFVGSSDPIVGVGEGTPCTQVMVSTNVTAGANDVYINSIHFNMNRIRWNGDIALSSNGTVFLAGLVVDWSDSGGYGILEEIKDSNTQNKGFFATVTSWFSSFFTNIGSYFDYLGNLISGLFLDITGYLGTIIGSIQDGFIRLISTVSQPFLSVFEPISNIIYTGIDTFISLITGVYQIASYNYA